jgi:phage terminase large subunit-like protein
MSHTSQRSLASQLADVLADGGWRSKARPEQLPPANWTHGWGLAGGRGMGKTWVGANVTNELAQSVSHIALVGPTAADVRDTMIEGVSGILRTAPPWFRPVYEPSKRRLEWPNGSIAIALSAEEPERARGLNTGFLWLDELCAWENAQHMWDMLQFGLRLGERPKWLFTSTPKPIRLLRDLLAREGKDVVITRGTTFDNAANLAPSFLESIKARYAGTRLGRQEINAEVLLDVQGALWTREMLDRANGSWKLPDMKRVVVAVDPSGTRGEEDSGDSVGIVVAGLGVDGFGYVLADKTCKLSPDGWGRVAVNAYHAHKADRIVAERNYGGAMVQHVIKTIDPNASYKEVTASRGKIARAEPISALYEQSKVRHAAAFTELEDQLAAMTSEGYVGDGSPDRADALVWALSELMGAPQQHIAFTVPFVASQPRYFPGSENPSWASGPPGGLPRAGNT